MTDSTSLLILAATIVVIVVVITTIINGWKKKAFIQDLDFCQRNIQQALLHLQELTDINHFFTEEEEQLFSQKHHTLYESAQRVISSKFLKKAKTAKAGIEDFATKYHTLSNLRESNNQLHEAYTNITRVDLLGKAMEDYSNILRAQSYFTESKKCEFVSKYSPVVEVLKLSFRNRELLNAIMATIDGSTSEQTLWDFCRDMERIDELKKDKNKDYVWNELRDNFQYFQSVLSYPLSDQQRNAIVLDEDNVLVVSSAGSGKTFSLQGKVKYLVEKLHVNPANILLVTFTREAANSLKRRINMDGVTCSTFDALANKIVATANEERPSICDEKNLSEYIFRQLFQRSEYLKAITDYLLLSSTTAQSELDAENTQELVESRQASDRRTLLPCMDGHVVFTKSEQERIIGDILAMNGVNYRYEEGYEHYVATKEHQQYKPDFSIYFTTTERVSVTDEDGRVHTEMRTVDKRIYLEHFGIGVDGQVPKWFAKEGELRQVATQHYTDGMNWKRNLHKERGTILLETTSADFQRLGSEGVEKMLLDKLAKAGVPIVPLSPDKIIEMMDAANPQRLRSVRQMVVSFVSLLKGSCKDLDSIIIDLQADCLEYKPTLADILKRKDGMRKHAEYLQKKRDMAILEKIIRPYYQLYQSRLEETNQKDFSDIINEATEYCTNNPTKRYDYILIDEFQDLSVIRYKFIQSLRSDTPYKTKLFCVGDDWQSIYRFAGSDISLFNNFASYFGFVEECKIETTYRFGEPTVSLSSRFILANPSQKVKQVKCLDTAHTELTCIPYKHEARQKRVVASNVKTKVAQILQDIPADKSVYFLGRYSFDVNTLSEAGFMVLPQGDRTFVQYNGREYPFLSVHRAKGLEADYIILLNCNSGTYGFPSAIEDDPVLSYVLSDKDQFRFAEERRLFYVAITRSIRHTYVLYDEKHPSIFLNGLIQETPPQYGYCPRCNKGHIIKFQEKVVSNGNTMIEYRCSNELYGCRFNKIEWINRPHDQRQRDNKFITLTNSNKTITI